MEGMTVTHPDGDQQLQTSRRSGAVMAVVAVVAGWMRWTRSNLLIVVLLAGLGVLHALVVAAHYHFGSFDDDAAYLLTAKALASGAGLTHMLLPGFRLTAVYPPGYAALLAPLTLLNPPILAYRIVSLVCFVAVFPLVWWYLGTRRVSDPVRVGVLLLLALNPVFATYATMVMPETLFLVVFVLFLLAANRWDRAKPVLTSAGVATVLLGAGLVWLKQAGVGLVIGLLVWLLIRRAWKKAAWLAAGVAGLFSPVLIARALGGSSLIGSRYSTDFGGYYTGGLLHRALRVPDAIITFFGSAVPRAVVPSGSPLPEEGAIHILLNVFEWSMWPLLLIGFVIWVRHHRDAACLIVPVYVLETLTYPYVNERRVILILPLILVWMVLGGRAAIRGLGVAMRLASRPFTRMALPALAGVLAAVTALALVVQFPRDYLYALGESSSAPEGSAYMGFLRSLGTSGDIVESNYMWSTALFTNHRTARGAFNVPCYYDTVAAAVHQDGAGYLLSAALNKPDELDNPCLLELLSAEPWAVRLYRTMGDDASVFELIGPGTAHPQLADLTSRARLAASAPVTQQPEAPQSENDRAGTYPSVPTAGGTATLTWSWDGPAAVQQVSVGGADASLGPTSSVTVQLGSPEGTWQTVASTGSAVGEGRATPWLLVAFPHPVPATAVRVTVRGQGDVAVHDLHVLGGGQ
jgi:hypothetical protein